MVAVKIMGKAYSETQRIRVKGLLEQGRDEESIEKETGVSDRTIRRWKLELERTGRIGKVCQQIPLYSAVSMVANGIQAAGKQNWKA